MNILGLVPARGGSKGVPRKNILPLAGRPLLAHSIDHGVKSKYVNKIVCTTDDEEIAEIAPSSGYVITKTGKQTWSFCFVRRRQYGIFTT